ncbi:MAG: hypothetical protein ACLQVL_33190 [Terriglobia bacterium]
MIPASEENALEFNLDRRDRSHNAQAWEGDRAESEEIPAYYKRRSAGVWTWLATLTVALAVMMSYGYTVLTRQGIQSEQIPGMTRSLSAIGQHLGSVERRLADSRADQQHLASQVQSIDAGSKVALGLTQQQTSQLVAHAQGAMLKQLKQQTAAFQAQVTQLASERQADRTQLAQMADQLTRTRTELETTRADYTRQVELLREQQGEEHRELASINNSLPTRQVPFEIQKNHKVQVASAVYLQVTKIDVRRQRFDGWIESTLGNPKVWIQSQGVGNPVVFYPGAQGKPVVMVVTSVDQKGAVGYLLLPATSSTSDQAPSISSASRQADPKAVLPSESSAVHQ